MADAAPRAAPPGADAVAVVVWNVHVGGGDVARVIDALARGDLTNGTPSTSFVLLLQEVYRSGSGVPVPAPLRSRGPKAIVEHPPGTTRRSVIDVARERGLAIVYVPSMRNTREHGVANGAEDRGNAIVSTWPITEPAAIELPFERQRRVAVAATIVGRTTGGVPWRLRVATAHLDTSLAWKRGGPLAARRRQAAALADAIGCSPLPTVVGGDLNTWFGDREPAVGALRRAFPQTPVAASGATWRGPLGSRATLDHLFARNLPAPVAIRRLAGRFGSDHFPLLALVGVAPTEISGANDRTPRGRRCTTGR